MQNFKAEIGASPFKVFEKLDVSLQQDPNPNGPDGNSSKRLSLKEILDLNHNNFKHVVIRTKNANLDFIKYSFTQEKVDFTLTSQRYELVKYQHSAKKTIVELRVKIIQSCITFINEEDF